MAVVYGKIALSLIKQNEYMKSLFKFKVKETTWIRLLLQYPEIYPKSTNFPCLSYHCSLLRNYTYSYGSVVYVANRWWKSSTIEICLGWVFSYCPENGRFAFAKSVNIWNTGQKIADILEEKKNPRKLQNCSGLKHDNSSWIACFIKEQLSFQEDSYLFFFVPRPASGEGGGGQEAKYLGLELIKMAPNLGNLGPTLLALLRTL